MVCKCYQFLCQTCDRVATPMHGPGTWLKAKSRLRKRILIIAGVMS